MVMTLFNFKKIKLQLSLLDNPELTEQVCIGNTQTLGLINLGMNGFILDRPQSYLQEQAQLHQLTQNTHFVIQ